LIKKHKVLGHFQAVIATRDIQPFEELFAKYSPSYWLAEPDENTELPDAHILTNERYETELSKYETAMRKMLELQVREQTSTQNTQLKE
jgi:hypothetical protein